MQLVYRMPTEMLGSIHDNSKRLKSIAVTEDKNLEETRLFSSRRQNLSSGLRSSELKVKCTKILDAFSFVAKTTFLTLVLMGFSFIVGQHREENLKFGHQIWRNSFLLAPRTL